MSGPTAIHDSHGFAWPHHDRHVEAHDRAPERLPEPLPPRVREDVFVAGADPAPPPTPPVGRKPYSVDPIGGPLPARTDLPPIRETVRAINWFEVTNLGTLLDVLA